MRKTSRLSQLSMTMSIDLSGMGMNLKMNKSYSRNVDHETYVHDVF